MTGESKILIENIKHFRKLLTEGVSDRVLVDAINEHKYLYIYYEGDDTIETGYRTIRPFVLGTDKRSGNLVLRAWQDKGRSDSLRPDAPRIPRFNHEKTVENGKVKPGWRLFIVDNITSAYPTGVKFIDKQGKVQIPPLYNEHDKDMSGIVAAVSANPEKEIQTQYTGATAQPKVPRYEKFKNANIKNRKLTKADVMALYDVATRVMKKSPSRFFVAIDDQDNYYIQDKNVKGKFPQNAIVGDLDVLYNKFVREKTSINPQSEKIIKQELDTLAKNTAQKQLEKDQNPPAVKENETFPAQRKTFFKI